METKNHRSLEMIIGLHAMEEDSETDPTQTASPGLQRRAAFLPQSVPIQMY